jgi:hypothetical protein
MWTDDTDTAQTDSWLPSLPTSSISNNDIKKTIDRIESHVTKYVVQMTGYRVVDHILKIEILVLPSDIYDVGRLLDKFKIEDMKTALKTLRDGNESPIYDLKVPGAKKISIFNGFGKTTVSFQGVTSCVIDLWDGRFQRVTRMSKETVGIKSMPTQETSHPNRQKMDDHTPLPKKQSIAPYLVSSTQHPPNKPSPPRPSNTSTLPPSNTSTLRREVVPSGPR